jgi:4-amino-4-deoxy-L-arabinose transferase-like glycosyltransferase
MFASSFTLFSLLFSIAALYFSFQQAKKGDYRASLILIIATGFVLRLDSCFDFFLHPWDERFHALVAKNMMSHPLIPALYSNPVLNHDFRNWMESPIWLYKPPLALWLIAISLKLFGISETAVRIPSLILATMAILFTYVIGKMIWDEKTGLLAASLHAISAFFIDLAGGRIPSDHVDSVFIFLIELGILLALLQAKSRKPLLIPLIGLCIGAAVMTRYLAGLIVIPVWLVFVWKQEAAKSIVAKLLLIVFFAGMICVPWNLYTLAKFPAESHWVQQVNLSHVFHAVDQHGGSVLYHWVKIAAYFGELAYIPIGIFAWLGFRSRQSPFFYGILAWFLIPYLLFSVPATKLPAYPMIAAPAVFLMISYTWWWLQPKKHWLITVLLILMIALPVRQTINRIKMFSDRERNPQWAQDLRSLKDKIGDSKEPIVLFNTEHPIEAMFYLPNVTAYSGLPGPIQERQLVEEHYRVLLLNGAQIVETSRREDNASFQQAEVPAKLFAGASYEIQVVMKNTGATTWDYPKAFGPYYALGPVTPRANSGCTEDQDKWSVTFVPVTGLVKPGEIATFRFRIKAPSKPGNYAMPWRMKKKTPSGWTLTFGDPSGPSCHQVLPR